MLDYKKLEKCKMAEAEIAVMRIWTEAENAHYWKKKKDSKWWSHFDREGGNVCAYELERTNRSIKLQNFLMTGERLILHLKPEQFTFYREVK